MATHLLKIYDVSQGNFVDAITLTQVTLDLTVYGITVAAHVSIGGLIYDNRILSVSGILIQPHQTDKGLIQGTILTL